MEAVIYRVCVEEDLPALLRVITEGESDNFFKAYSPAYMRAIFNATRDYPEGFIVAEHNSEIIGVICEHVLAPDLVFGGVYYVTKRFHGTGVGRELANRAQSFVGDRNDGFAFVESPSSLDRHSRGVPGYTFEVFTGRRKTSTERNDNTDVKLLSLNEIDSNKLVEYDESINQRGNVNFVESYLHLEGVVTVVAMTEKRVVGYGVMDTTHAYANIISPLYADSLSIAKSLMMQLVKLSGSRKFRTVSLCSNPEFLAFLETNFERVVMNDRFKVCVYFSKKLVPIRDKKIFAPNVGFIYMS